MRVLGIDPGYDRTGVAILGGSGSAPEHLYSNCVTTDRSDTFPERLRMLAKELRKVIKKHGPSACAIETLYVTNNQKTAMGVSAARGVALLIAAEHSLPVAEYTPQQIKIAVTGYGKSDKRAVAAMLLRLVPASKSATFDDEVDAIAVALTHLAHLRATYPHKRP